MIPIFVKFNADFTHISKSRSKNLESSNKFDFMRMNIVGPGYKNLSLDQNKAMQMRQRLLLLR